MKLLVVDRRADASWRPAGQELARLQTICAAAGRADWTVDLVLVEDEEMVRLNEAYRAESGPTDVLSFSYLEDQGQGTPHLAAGCRHAGCDLWRDHVAQEAIAPVGEIVLAPGFVAERCRRHGWSFAEEVALLIAHGTLHILGWTHGDELSTATMRAEEARLLQRGGYRHPLREGG